MCPPLSRFAAVTIVTSFVVSSVFLGGCADQPGSRTLPVAGEREELAAEPEMGDSSSALRDSREATRKFAPPAPKASESATPETAGAPEPTASPTASTRQRAETPPLAPAELDALSAEPSPLEGQGPGQAGDRFDPTPDNDFFTVTEEPLSTFSIDVDTASYTKTRRYLLQNGVLPPPDAVRIEEFINYFDYAYPAPEDEHPFAVHVEVADCPWRDGHQLARVGIQGRRMEEDRPAANLVFLIDVSGSMSYADKLPLVKQSLALLASRLRENDRVAIVVYAGAAGLVLPSTTGDQPATIQAALDRLHAGGSTNGGQGIQLAYQVALDNYLPGGVNRVLLCTDGDFNVGTTSTGQLVRLAEQHARSGVYLSVLAFGQGNHNDAMLEQLSNRANGNYAFIDTAAEARKVLVEQLAGTLVTIAKDVKLQVEFNPRRVASYRLIGYANRKLAARDFNDDQKDAGEIGAGHQVTALYELVPSGGEPVGGDVDPLKYQTRDTTPASDASDEWMTVKVRYKQPEESTSTLLSYPVATPARRFGETPDDFQFASAVASFGMLLRHSPHRGDASYASVWEIASSALGEDAHGYRRELLEMVRRAAELDQRYPTPAPGSLSSQRVPPRQVTVLPARGQFTPPTASQPLNPPASSAASRWPELTRWPARIADQLGRPVALFWLGASFGLVVAVVLLLGTHMAPRVRSVSDRQPTPFADQSLPVTKQAVQER